MDTLPIVWQYAILGAIALAATLVGLWLYNRREKRRKHALELMRMMDQWGLDWFAGLSAERRLPPTEPHPSCSHYTDHLLAAAYTEPFSRLLQILFGVESARFRAWNAIGKAEPLPEGIHGEIIRRRTNPALEAYVESLHGLTLTHPHPDNTAFRRVLGLERDLWRMTWEG